MSLLAIAFSSHVPLSHIVVCCPSLPRPLNLTPFVPYLSDACHVARTLTHARHDLPQRCLFLSLFFPDSDRHRPVRRSFTCSPPAIHSSSSSSPVRTNPSLAIVNSALTSSPTEDTECFQSIELAIIAFLTKSHFRNMKSNATKLIQISTDKTTPLCRAKTTAAEIASRFVSVRSLVRFSYVPTHTSRARNGAYVGRKEGRKEGRASSSSLPPSRSSPLPGGGVGRRGPHW